MYILGRKEDVLFVCIPQLVFNHFLSKSKQSNLILLCIVSGRIVMKLNCCESRVNLHRDLNL